MNPQDHISKYCTYFEAVHSPTAERKGIKNVPTEDQIEAMKHVGVLFDQIRDYLMSPLTVSSFFRSPALNAAIGGSSKTSQHMKGEAIDVYKPGRHLEIFNFVRNHCEYDQCISEYGTEDSPAWIHISKVRPGHGTNRKQSLRCELIDGKITYRNYP